jgi:anti-sigma factor RsiW
MKCEDVSNELIAYLDRRANSAERRDVEEHIAVCAGCRTRAEEFRKLWSVLDEVPAIEPSFAFDARLRQRVAAEPRRNWLAWLVPQPRLAFSMVMLIALSVWMATLAPPVPVDTETSTKQQFEMIKDLGVLENYDVLTKLDALSELTPAAAQSVEPKNGKSQQDDGG